MVVVQLRAINVSTHSRPKAAEIAFNLELKYGSVSTHSRPKAAGYAMYQGAEESRVFQHTAARRRLPKRTTALHPRLGFNTQPPEGGCPWFKLAMHDDGMFQHTAARRRLSRLLPLTCALAMFQHTAARRRLVNLVVFLTPVICFNTQPPEGGCGEYAVATNWRGVSTHSRPKAAGVCKMSLLTRSSFQHTAARRRLHLFTNGIYDYQCFNTQPPEGGWPGLCAGRRLCVCFNTQPPEGGWPAPHTICMLP